ncbi:glycine-rich domain-containing protein 1-like isoform X2 [Phragmites australis]|uniref:glycine-rich domain-containing protein 1-like isoform X2 n=1 Tax=Phragmites australis TaxID=29695 RepID=UPI002D7742E3|nr:glycine-rich domain-containing protein 1-like isoform X2 [Phragmites australis]
MNGDQASRWAAAQEGVAVGADLATAALRQLEFLAAVDLRRWLYEGPLLERAIHRYKACWLPLLAKHTRDAVVDGPLVVPLDCEWIWHCHRLNPAQYIRDCKKVYGRILNNDNVESSIRTKSKLQSEKVWTELYPEEPFELEYKSSSDTAIDVNPGAAEGISYDLVSAVKRQSSFYYQVGTPTMHDQRFLEEALARYKGFLYLIKMNQEKGMQRFHVPTYDVDLMWHTHQLHPVTYRNDMLKLLGKVLEHDDTDSDRSEGKKLDVGFTETAEQFENTFGVRYCKAGSMYRGNMPSPVTAAPQMFSSEVGNGLSIFKAEKQLNVLQTTVVELYLKIVDINNLPSAIPKENVHVWFTKNQSDMFISDGGRLDISTNTGKSIGAGFQCEPTGELILTVMVDQASKKSEPIGKVSIPLQELTGPDSKLSFERWFELKPHGRHASSPPVSLRVAASSTVPTRAQQVLRMIRMEPFSLNTCLLPPSITDQKMGSRIRFVYDCGTELIRLQIREHKAKNGMAFIRELVGVSKPSKTQFQLAEFKENKWTLKNSNLSIADDAIPSDSADGCMLVLKGDNQLVKLYRGRRLEYEPRCCNRHSQNASAVTAVKFCAEHPYGKAVALLDTESQFIMVNEDWFLLPWIAISFLSLDNTDGGDGAKLIGGAMVQKGAMSESDATMVSEAVAVGGVGAAMAPAQCGTCGTASGGNMVVASDKADDASMAIGSGEEADAKCGGCGSGCGAGCGSMVTANSKDGHASCGTCRAIVGTGGSCKAHAKSGGCGSGCGGGCGGGAMFNASTMAGQAKPGGCGSGCGGGCGGGGSCGAMFNASTMAGQAKPGGCGGCCGAGGGCGAMVVESSKPCHTRSAGCGSGCGGGCSAIMFNASSACKAGQGEVRSGGCGSGCGGGCGGAVFNASACKTGQEAESAGCGSGCGGGCGGGGMFNA